MYRTCTKCALQYARCYMSPRSVLLRNVELHLREELFLPKTPSEGHNADPSHVICHPYPHIDCLAIQDEYYAHFLNVPYKQLINTVAIADSCRPRNPRSCPAEYILTNRQT